MKIATWNVNSVKSRLQHLTDWLRQTSPDVLLLQELKCVEEAFPALEIEELGYNLAVVGQKTYNGVAIISNRPLEIEATSLPGDEADEQARYVEAVIGTVRIASLYLPNGNPAGTEKYEYKLAWMERLYNHARRLLDMDEAFVLGGDFNVIPSPDDVYDPKAFEGDALFHPRTLAAYRKILNLGLTEAYTALNPSVGRYTWWDYRSGAWQKDHGARIDHLLLSPQAADRLLSSGIDRVPRGWEKPSDHTPVWCELSED